MHVLYASLKRRAEIQRLSDCESVRLPILWMRPFVLFVLKTAAVARVQARLAWLSTKQFNASVNGTIAVRDIMGSACFVGVKRELT